MTTYALLTEDEKYCVLVSDNTEAICKLASETPRPLVMRSFDQPPEIVAQVLVNIGYKVRAVQ